MPGVRRPIPDLQLGEGEQAIMLPYCDKWIHIAYAAIQPATRSIHRRFSMSKERCKVYEKPRPEIEKCRVTTGPMASDPSYANNGQFRLRCPKTGALLLVQVSDGEDWEHASISVREEAVGKRSKGRTPTWDEMNWVKDQFWRSEETVIQYHPPHSQYVNVHPGVLHLWRPTDAEIPLPPRKLV